MFARMNLLPFGKLPAHSSRRFVPEQIEEIKKAFRLLLQSNLNTSQAVEAIKAQVSSPEVQIILDFIEKSDRGVIK